MSKNPSFTGVRLAVKFPHGGALGCNWGEGLLGFGSSLKPRRTIVWSGHRRLTGIFGREDHESFSVGPCIRECCPHPLFFYPLEHAAIPACASTPVRSGKDWHRHPNCPPQLRTTILFSIAHHRVALLDVFLISFISFLCIFLESGEARGEGHGKTNTLFVSRLGVCVDEKWGRMQKESPSHVQ